MTIRIPGHIASVPRDFPIYRNPYKPQIASQFGYNDITMKNFFTSTVARLSMCAAALALSAPAWAEPIEMGDDNRAIEPGVEYIIKQYHTASGHYTSVKNSKIYFDGGQSLVPYYDESHQELVPTKALDNTSYMQWFMGEEGKTYYFYTGFAMDDGEFVLYQEGVVDKPLHISLMQPVQNHLVDFNNYSYMEVTFNQDIVLGSNVAKITFANRLTNEKETIETRASASGQMLRVSMYNQLKPFMESGAIRTGDEYQVTVNGLTSTVGVPFEGADKDGDAVFTFLCGSLPVVVIRQNIPNPFLSYWAPGAPEAQLSMEFDAKLMPSDETVVVLGWGNQEADGEYYAETVPCKIEGNTLTADFSGKLRTPALMTPMFPNAMYDNMVVGVMFVRDEFGVPVASPDQGTTGSYTFTPAYKLIERTSVIAEFTPGTGSLLEDVDNINVWMTGLTAIKFDGFLLTIYDKNNKVSTLSIPLKDVTISNATATEAEYDFKLPADVKKNAKRVEITLDNVRTVDGYDHSNEVRCIYGGFAILYSEPANNEEIEIMKADSKIMIETNISETYPDMFVLYQIVDTYEENEEPIIKSTAEMQRQEDGSYVAELPQDLKLYAGHDYKIEVTAWIDEMTCWNEPDNNFGTDFILVKGLTPAYHYSEITLKSITPAADTMIGNDVTEIVLDFDGLVYLGNYDEEEGELRTYINVGQGIVKPFAAVTPAQPIDLEGHTCSNHWTLTLPEGYVASLTAPLEISFTVYDQDSLQLKGNRGSEENSFYSFSWNLAGMYDSVEVKADGEAQLGDVTTFTVSNENGVNVSWNIPVEEAVVTFNGEVVAHVSDVQFPEIDFTKAMTEVYLVLDKTLTENGTYTLTIPQDYFVIGEEESVKNSLAVTYEFTIVNGSAVDIVAADAAFTVYSLTGVRLLDNAPKDALQTLEPGLYIVNGHKMILK